MTADAMKKTLPSSSQTNVDPLLPFRFSGAESAGRPLPSSADWAMGPFPAIVFMTPGLIVTFWTVTGDPLRLMPRIRLLLPSRI